MLILADENVPGLVVTKLRNQGFDVTHIREISPGISDDEVLQITQKEGRVLLTFDKDFGEAIFQSRARIPGVILIRLRSCSPDYLADIIVRTMNLGLSWVHQFTVVKENRIRQIKLKNFNE